MHDADVVRILKDPRELGFAERQGAPPASGSTGETFASQVVEE